MSIYSRGAVVPAGAFKEITIGIRPLSSSCAQTNYCEEQKLKKNAKLEIEGRLTLEPELN